MELSWGTVLREATLEHRDMHDSLIVSCGDVLPLPVLAEQRKLDPHDSKFYDSFAVEHGNT